MNILIDLRHGFPPLLNLLIHLLITLFPPKARNQFTLPFYIHRNPPILNLALFLFLLFCLIFLVVSLKLRLEIPPVPPLLNPVYVRAGDFSLPLGFSLLASLLFPPQLFWGFLAILAVLSSSDGFLWKRLVSLVCRVMLEIPAIIVTFALSDGHLPETADQIATELEMVEIQR